MNCKICGSNNVKAIYRDQIRDGGIGNYTKEPVTVWQCEECSVIWHENVIVDTGRYYESEEYRESLEGSSEAKKFYELHDKETLDKLQYTGTDIYRNKIVVDIGCGCGAFLDFLKGVAIKCIAVEPSEKYRMIMEEKGYQTYDYTHNAIRDWKESIDIVTSFDVIEHVEDPKSFISDIYSLLKKGGSAIIGTPTDAPVMRRLLSSVYEQKLLFSTQHLWIFSKKCLEKMFHEAGFHKVNIKYFQRYGLDNLLGWIVEKSPCCNIDEEFITPALDSLWRSECSKNEMADYLVLYCEK